MRKALDSDSKKITSELYSDFQMLSFQSNENEIPPFIKLFWEEQQKYISLSNSVSIIYHPMIIKYCLKLRAKSPSAYKDPQYDSTTGTVILVLQI